MEPTWGYAYPFTEDRYPDRRRPVVEMENRTDNPGVVDDEGAADQIDIRGPVRTLTMWCDCCDGPIDEGGRCYCSD